MSFRISVFVLIFVITASCFTQAAGGDTPVFVAKTGKKYHLSGCGSLSRSRLELPLQEAVRSGYTPCSVCNPPRLSGEKTPVPPPAGGVYRVNLAEPPGYAGVDFSRLLEAAAEGHVDGDTIRVRIANPPEGLSPVETIRLIGVDTPETVHPRRGVEAFGPEASDFTKQRLLGRTVYLAFDWDLRDRYGRLLAYVYTQDGRCHNAEIIREGYGHAYTRFPFRFLEEFRSLEREARQKERGLWGK